MIFRTLLIAFLFINILAKGQVKELIFDTAPEYSSELMNYKGLITNILTLQPVDSVEISADSQGVLGYTDSSGRFNLKASANVSRLNFHKKGFTGSSFVFVTHQARTDSILIQLFPELLSKEEQEQIEKNYPLSGSNEASGDILRREESLLKAGVKNEVPATIRVLMPDGTVVVMAMDEYLKGVVPAEVPPSWDMNALKAQAVAARSYATANFKHAAEGADVCTTTHCQAWKATQNSRTSQAVTETSNVSVKYNGTVINALFFSHCDGHTRNNEDKWGGTPVPYLRSKSCICGYTYHNAHGVGMCQYGSQAMASNGSSWSNILTYYYTGTEIDNATLETGTLTGVIYHGSDNSNLANRIEGATVKLNTGEEVVSGTNGLYSFNLTPGEYTVTASKDGFKSASVTRQVTAATTIWGSIQLTQATDIPGLTLLKRNIFPNPAKEYITIEPIGKVRVIITQIAGVVEYDNEIRETTRIDVSSYKRGVYVIQLIGDNSTYSEKIVLVD